MGAGFVEERGELFCVNDFEKYLAPKCAQCSRPIVGVGVVWCGVVWCGVVWGGVVWCGVVWGGVVWGGVV